MTALLILIIFIWWCGKEDRAFNNYMPPDGYMVDWNAMQLDKIKNNLSNYECKRNIVNGKYNVRKNY